MNQPVSTSVDTPKLNKLQVAKPPLLQLSHSDEDDDEGSDDSMEEPSNEKVA